MSLNTTCSDILKKEATGIDDFDLGEVQQIGTGFIVTEKGIINKKRYYIPKNLIEDFDGHTLYFRIMRAESKRFRWDDLKVLKSNHSIVNIPYDWPYVLQG